MDPSFQPGKALAPATQVEITVSCKNLKDRDIVSKSDPMCVLFIKEFASQNFIEVGRTEIVKNCLNPEFSHRFIVDYRFEESQRLKFEIYDVDNRSSKLSQQDFLGRLECTLGEVIGTAGNKIHRNLTGLSGKLGSIIISAEEVGTSKEVLLMQWKGEKLDKKDFLGKSDPFIQIYRIQDDGSATLIHRTETIRNTLNPVWKPFRISMRQMCAGKPDRPIRFDVYDWDDDGGHDFIGSFQTSVAHLQQQGAATQRVFELINPKKKAKKKDYKHSGTLHLVSLAVEIEHSFLEYVQGGTQINFTVAIDFTASNGNPSDPNSLHYIHPHIPNAYMVALKSVGEICQDYDSDKMFPALGFGAKLPPSGIVSHEFFLNFNPSNPYCYRIEGVMEAYRRSLMSVQLYGPTNFAPVINHVARIASGSKDGSNYFVLLIITDGVISDMDNTITAIINASFLPMSIIIVGVGIADFAAMDVLDSDNKVLANSQGRRAQRDIVQFVPMRNYLNASTGGNIELSQARLAKDVLAEIPQQFVSYMKFNQIKPKPPIQIANPQLTTSSNADAEAADNLPNKAPPFTTALDAVYQQQTSGSAPQYPQQQPPPPPQQQQQQQQYQTSAGAGSYQQNFTATTNYPPMNGSYQQPPPVAGGYPAPPYQQQQSNYHPPPQPNCPQMAPNSYPAAAPPGYPAPSYGSGYPSSGTNPGYPNSTMPPAYPQNAPPYSVQQNPGYMANPTYQQQPYGAGYPRQ